MRRTVGFVAVFAALSFAASGCHSSSKTAPATTSPSTNVQPVSTNTSLPARWWLWTESAPAIHDPVEDSTGVDCALNQPADVWFLAGTYGGPVERTCTIAAGHEIYFPVLNTICEVQTGQAVSEALSNCALVVTSATATLDGKQIKVVSADSGTAFQINIRENSPTSLSPGIHTVVAAGVWSGPITLSPGPHRLVFAGKSPGFDTEATYHLTVQ